MSQINADELKQLEDLLARFPLPLVLRAVAHLCGESSIGAEIEAYETEQKGKRLSKLSDFLHKQAAAVDDDETMELTAETPR